MTRVSSDTMTESLYRINIVVNMSTASGNNHQGMFMENGSGGFMGGKLSVTVLTHTQ